MREIITQRTPKINVREIKKCLVCDKEECINCEDPVSKYRAKIRDKLNTKAKEYYRNNKARILQQKRLKRREKK